MGRGEGCDDISELLRDHQRRASGGELLSVDQIRIKMSVTQAERSAVEFYESLLDGEFDDASELIAELIRDEAVISDRSAQSIPFDQSIPFESVSVHLAIFYRVTPDSFVLAAAPEPSYSGRKKVTDYQWSALIESSDPDQIAQTRRDLTLALGRGGASAAPVSVGDLKQRRRSERWKKGLE